MGDPAMQLHCCGWNYCCEAARIAARHTTSPTERGEGNTDLSIPRLVTPPASLLWSRITDLEPPELKPGTQPRLQREGNTDLSIPRWVTQPASLLWVELPPELQPGTQLHLQREENTDLLYT
jgi:hypothetical protein